MPQFEALRAKCLKLIPVEEERRKEFLAKMMEEEMTDEDREYLELQKRDKELWE